MRGSFDECKGEMIRLCILIRILRILMNIWYGADDAPGVIDVDIFLDDENDYSYYNNNSAEYTSDGSGGKIEYVYVHDDDVYVMVSRGNIGSMTTRRKRRRTTTFVAEEDLLKSKI